MISCGHIISTNTSIGYLALPRSSWGGCHPLGTLQEGPVAQVLRAATRCHLRHGAVFSTTPIGIREAGAA